MADFVKAVAKATGEKQDVPVHWLELAEQGVHGFDFKVPPSKRETTKSDGRTADKKEQ